MAVTNYNGPYQRSGGSQTVGTGRTPLEAGDNDSGNRVLTERSTDEWTRGAVVDAVAGALDHLGIISAERFDSTTTLAWPRIVTSLGLGGLYFALLFETCVPGGANYWRFWTGRWKAVSRRYRPSSG